LLLYSATIFLSAFLLFQVQPLIAKRILPWFGGGPGVWTACMLFFQAVLLAGYGYAHLVRSRLGQRRQVVLHLLLLAAAALLLPIAPADAWKPGPTADPTWRILALLAACVGLPYLVLSSTSPLLQAWLSLTHPDRSPYRLYSLSNVGSLLALLSYPSVVEPALALGTQAAAWSGGFVVFGVLCGACALRTWHATADDQPAAGPAAEAEGVGAEPPLPPPRRPSLAERLLWLALPACGSVMLLSVTNQMCADVAVVPFLWVLPLSLYLLSFILCFHTERWYVRPVFWVLLAGSMVGMVLLMHGGVDVALWVQILGYSGGLFVCCMVCHGELVRLKPAPRYLTSFYLMTAGGGALGGVLVSVVAPRVFPSYFELHVGMWACCALAVAAFWREAQPHRRWRRRWLAWAYVPVLVLLLVVLGEALRREAHKSVRWSESVSRSFYGVLRVVAYEEHDAERMHRTLQHGRISHGSQFADEARRGQPTTYYGEASGVGLALRHLARDSSRRVGVVGLGVGTIAAYGQEGDHYRFYEINPQVLDLATTTFTYLLDSPADCVVVLGDARLSLEREEAQRLDVLALDAFNSDAIPVHLLTREAFEIYLRHLKPTGVLAVHTSNRYVDLLPVVHALASHFGLGAAVIDSDDDDDELVDACVWVLLTKNREFLRSEPVRQAASPEDEMPPPCRLWTDDYSNLFRSLR